MPLYGPEGAIAGIGLASSSKGVDCSQQNLWVIYNLSVQFYANYWRLNEKQDMKKIPTKITPREKEILQWLAAGSTKSEVADILKISYHTVDYHSRQILLKFKARSITAAVHFATAQGYL
jgi:DNA-binding CsgD family transcriptional regulator